MIKDKFRQVLQGKNSHPARIVGRPGDTGCLGDKDRGRGVHSGVAARIGIGMKLSGQVDLQARLLESFPDRRLFKGFAVIDKPARQGPPEGGVFPFYEHNAPIELDNDVNGGYRISIIRKLFATFWTVHDAITR